MELYKLSMQTWFYVKNISTAGSHILIDISVDVDGTRPRPGIGLFAKIVKGLKPLTVFAESSVFGFRPVSDMLPYIFGFSM